MLTCYPQLATGAMVQYPLRKTSLRRSVLNRLADGSTVRYVDPDASLCSWELRYRGLSDSERESIERFFRSAEGRLNTFLFLDPLGNLLSWSEDFSHGVWHKDSLLRIEQDESRVRITNTAQTPQRLQQTAKAPGWYHYCLSTSVRSASELTLVLRLQTGDGMLEAQHSVGTEERVVFCSGAIDGAAEEITAVLELPAGGIAELRGIQLQPQPGASEYRRTTSQNGIFPATRFDQDLISFQANGMNDHATVVRLVSRIGV